MSSSIKYGSNMALIGPSPSDSDHIGKMNYLRLVQKFDLSISSQNVSVVGIGSKKEKAQVQFPEVINGSFDYFVSDGVNERLLGLRVESPLDLEEEERKSISNGLLQRRGQGENEDMRISTNNNIFLLSNLYGEEAVQLKNEDLEDFFVLGLGNCYVNSYSVACALGEIPSARVTFSSESFYLKRYESHTVTESGIEGMKVPAVKQVDGSPSDHDFVIDDRIYDLYNYDGSLDPLRTSPNVVETTSPTSMGISISGNSIGFLNENNTEENKNFQSFSLDIKFPRYDYKTIQSQFSHDRPIVFPCRGVVSVAIIVDEMFEKDSRITKEDEFELSLSLGNASPENNFNEHVEMINYNIKGAKLESQNFSQDVGGEKMIWEATFSFLEGESTDLFYEELHSGTKGLFVKGLNQLGEESVTYEDEGEPVEKEGDGIFPTYIKLG